MPRPVSNPPSRLQSSHYDEWEGEPPPADLQIYEEEAKTAVSENKSPDIGFQFSVNPYRGCFHGCAYCYARPSHQYWGFGAGTDFERRIIVKTNIVSRLKEALQKSKKLRGQTIVFSGNTDCYQPLEAHYQLTRGCLSACIESQNPVTVITKSGGLIARDVDLLAELASSTTARVFFSIPFAEAETAKKIEPWVASPQKRLETMRTLSGAGIPTGIAIAPIIPGLNDHSIPTMLERAREAGATAAFMTLIRLSREVLPVFNERLEEAFPLRADKVRHAIQSVRSGKMNNSEFGERMIGGGPRWRLIEDLFYFHRKKLGMDEPVHKEKENIDTRPHPSGQLSLFE